MPTDDPGSSRRGRRQAAPDSAVPGRTQPLARAATSPHATGVPRRHSGSDPRQRHVTVDVVDAQGRPARTAPGLAGWLADVAPGRIRGRATVALISDARMRALNRAYRGADYATDVLSFPAETSDSEFLGDIVIAKGVAARQARQRRHALGTEVRVLALHGLLHLAGFDHERDGGEMAAVERRLRRKGNLAEGLIEREVKR